ARPRHPQRIRLADAARRGLVLLIFEYLEESCYPSEHVAATPDRPGGRPAPSPQSTLGLPARPAGRHSGDPRDGQVALPRAPAGRVAGDERPGAEGGGLAPAPGPGGPGRGRVPAGPRR